MSLVLAAGCSSGGLVSTDGGAGSGADRAVAPAADLAGPVRDLAGTAPIALTIGPIQLAAPDEKTMCSRFKLPASSAVDIIEIDATLAPGSHHLIIYKSMESTEAKDPYPCGPLDISKGDIPLYIAETQHMNRLPLPNGVAYHLEAGQMIRLEAHNINATPSPIAVMGEVTLTVGVPATYQPADIMFCGSALQLYTTGVPPGATDLNPGFYKPPTGIKLFGLTTHEHSRGTLMTVDKSTSTAPGTNLTQGKPWDNPPFQVWPSGSEITFDSDKGEGLQWQCHYQNDGNKTYKFGQSAFDNEMCFFWGYYYPSVGHFITKECLR